MSGFTSSSVGRKIVMSLSGLFLIIFLLVHLGVNLTLFGGHDAFNAASHFMATNPIIQPMQFVLAAGFIIHIIMGIRLELQNRAARPAKYVKNNAAANSRWASRNMIVTGLMVLLFIVIHLKDFFYEIKFGEVASDYDLVTGLFKNPFYVILYVLAFVLLGLHLSHGFQSSFTSIGARNAKYYNFIRKFGIVYSYFIAIGFSIIAIYFYFV